MDKKRLEQRCIELTRDYVESRVNEKSRKYINSLVPICDKSFIPITSERPDFVVNYGECSYVIEHFLVDFCNDGVNNNQSESRRANRDVMSIYKKYHDPDIGTIKDTDIVCATQEIEDEMNKIINTLLSFDYGKYVEAFRRVFEHYYSRANDDLSNKLIKANINCSYSVIILRDFGADFLWICVFTLVFHSIVYLRSKRIFAINL